MDDKYVLVEYLTNINDVIRQPLQQTQRIKFTCFDVSASYLVFGASSGGLYIFNRHPCEFIKLIPSKEGAIVEVTISSDEKTVALSTVKGAVIIIRNCLCDANVRFQIYSVGNGSVITAMRWWSDELYCGDQTGKVSVISHANLLSKAIFQLTCEPLMHLDSPVIQLDVHLKHLLVSTRSRTYLCDIEREEYRQIGKKMRDGNFGACFHKTESTDRTEGDVKIYCARPGCRLWEADFGCNVVYTHQFRNSLNLKPTDVVHLSEDGAANLRVTEFPESTRIPESFNFGTLSMLNNFITTFDAHGVYMFVASRAALVFWSNHVTGIKEVKVVNNFVYIWTTDFRIAHLRLIKLERLILKVFSQKRYNLCADLCIHYKDHVMKLIESDRLHFIIALRKKLVDDDNLIQLLNPLLDKIKQRSGRVQKLKSGIFVVDNVHFYGNDSTRNLYSQMLDTLPALKSVVTDGVVEETSQDNMQILQDSVKNLTTDRISSINSNEIRESAGPPDASNLDAFTENTDVPVVVDLSYVNIFRKQYEVNKINNSLVLPELAQFLHSKNLNETVELFVDFAKSTWNESIKEENDIKSWCHMQLLHYVSRSKLNEIETANSETLKFLTESFVKINKTNDVCTCRFPLPTAKSIPPVHYPVGCAILQKTWSDRDTSGICDSVPFMHKYLLGCLRKNEDVEVLLPILMQFGDLELLSEFCHSFSYDSWDTATKLLIKLKRNLCLNCERTVKFDKSVLFNWTDFANLMVRSVGGSSSVKLLTRYSKCVPPGELDFRFYQRCMFTTILDGVQERSKAAGFLERVDEDRNTGHQFDVLMSAYLSDKYLGRSTEKSADARDVCSACEISLQSPVLKDDGVRRLDCGHHCHAICFNNCKFCNRCSTKI